MKYKIRRPRKVKAMPVMPKKGYINKRGSATKIKVSAEQVSTVNKMEKSLGLDKIKPIILTSSEAEDNFDRDKEYFKDMYEGELRELFKKS